MRTYAPAEPGAVLDDLLAEPSLARGVVHHAVLAGARRRSTATFPDWLDPRIVAGLAGARHRAPVHPPGRGDRGGPRRRGRRRRHPDRVGQDAVLRAARSSRRSPRTRPPGRSSSSRPRRSARTRWPSSAELSRGGRAARSRRRPTTATRRRPIRSAIRTAGQVVVTNPDMLHSAILPHHTKWFQLFEQLRFIVIDELHTYRGVFGSHVANVLRRLLRICAHYGSHPVIVCCSATIGNPGELAEALTGRPVRRRRPQRRARPASATSCSSIRRSSTRRAAPAARPSRSPSAGRCRSCAPAARRSSSAGRGSRSSCC